MKNIYYKFSMKGFKGMVKTSISDFSYIPQQINKAREDNAEKAGVITAALPAIPVLLADAAVNVVGAVGLGLADVATAVATIPLYLMFEGSSKLLEKDNMAAKVVGGAGAVISGIPLLATNLGLFAVNLVGGGIVKLTDVVCNVAIAPFYYLGKGVYKLVTAPKANKLKKEIFEMESNLYNKVKEEVQKNENKEIFDLRVNFNSDVFANKLFINANYNYDNQLRFECDLKDHKINSKYFELGRNLDKTNFKNYKKDLQQISEILDSSKMEVIEDSQEQDNGEKEE